MSAAQTVERRFSCVRLSDKVKCSPCISGVKIVGAIGPKKTHNTYNAFKNFVKSRNVNFIEYDSIKDDSLIKLIKNLKIDIAVVCSFNDKIPLKFINAIKDGIINLHPSLLPQYRGGNPYARVIMNGEKQTGVTLHFMSEGFDEGDIIAQEVCELFPYETMGTIFNRTNNIGVAMLVKALIHYEKTGSLPRTKQPEGEFIKAPNIADEEMILNFNKPATELERLVRALNPYFSAVTFFKNQVVRVHKATVAHLNDVEKYSNGQICAIKDNKVYIKTSDGCIIPEVLQFSGYFTGDCIDFIRITQPNIGDTFTNGYS